MKNQLLIIIIGLFVNMNSVHAQKIFDIDAYKHFGETLTVRGRVNDYKLIAGSKGILLYCGRQYPNNYFTVIVKNVNVDLAKHEAIKGWTFSVTGKIIKYRGMPAITVKYLADVKTTMFADAVPNDI